MPLSRDFMDPPDLLPGRPPTRSNSPAPRTRRGTGSFAGLGPRGSESAQSVLRRENAALVFAGAHPQAFIAEGFQWWYLCGVASFSQGRLAKAPLSGGGLSSFGGAARTPLGAPSQSRRIATACDTGWVAPAVPAQRSCVSSCVRSAL